MHEFSTIYVFPLYVAAEVESCTDTGTERIVACGNHVVLWGQAAPTAAAMISFPLIQHQAMHSSHGLIRCNLTMSHNSLEEGMISTSQNGPLVSV